MLTLPNERLLEPRPAEFDEPYKERRVTLFVLKRAK
jgi:hypothetical protein